MITKQKLLDAMGLTIDCIGEDRLLDILLDAYKAKGEEIARLKGENCHEREVMHAEREQMRAEYSRIRQDPLYFVSGQYYFVARQHRFSVIVNGDRIEAFERVGTIDYAGVALSRKEWENYK